MNEAITGIIEEFNGIIFQLSQTRETVRHLAFKLNKLYDRAAEEVRKGE